MPSIIIPSEEAVRELRWTHESTFWIECLEDQPSILYLKLTPTRALSVLNGAPIELSLESGSESAGIIEFTLRDLIESPYYLSRPIDSAPFNMSAVRAMFEPSTRPSKLMVGLFDWQAKCLYSDLVEVLGEEAQPLAEGTPVVQTSPNAVRNAETRTQVLRLTPMTGEDSAFHRDHTLIRRLGPDPYIIGTNKQAPSVRLSDYSEDGRHGYAQEQLLAAECCSKLRLGTELFISPRKTDGTELTDLVIAADGIVVLLESKASRPFERTPRKSRSHQNALTNLVKKAFRQLDKARHTTLERINEIEPPLSAMLPLKHVVTCCIIDDGFMIYERSLRNWIEGPDGQEVSNSTFILELEDFLGLLNREADAPGLAKRLHSYSQVVSKTDALPMVIPRFRGVVSY